MSIQNLRNKYSDHPLFIPIIKYCDKNNISFEIVKETRILENYKIEKVYYTLIDGFLVTKYITNSWDNISSTLDKIYDYLKIQKPKELIKVLDFFKAKRYE